MQERTYNSYQTGITMLIPISVNLLLPCLTAFFVNRPLVSQTTVCLSDDHLSVWRPFVCLTTVCLSDDRLSVWRPFVCQSALCQSDSRLLVWGQIVRLLTVCLTTICTLCIQKRIQSLQWPSNLKNTKKVYLLSNL